MKNWLKALTCFVGAKKGIIDAYFIFYVTITHLLNNYVFLLSQGHHNSKV